MSWLPFVPTIISSIIQLVKLLIELSDKKNSADVKQCSTALEAARKSGDTSKFDDLIKKMKEGKPCE